MTSRNLNEQDIIALLDGCSPARGDVVLGIGDDGALLEVPAGQQLVTVMDTLVSGVHFPEGTSPEHIGYRALAVNLSDMAAMAAIPAWATLSLTLPTADADWVRGFASGWAEAAGLCDVALVGGDTVRGAMNVSVALHGFVSPGEALLRSAARAGDAVFVTGTLGDAAAGLALLQNRLTAGNSDEEALLQRFLKPTPRLAQSSGLHGKASAGLDLSDGLVKDAGRLAAASGVLLALDAGALPVSQPLLRAVGKARAMQLALTGGDDYELLFTVRPSAVAQLEKLSRAWQCRCTRIGEVRAGEGVHLSHKGRPMALPASEFEHFA